MDVKTTPLGIAFVIGARQLLQATMDTTVRYVGAHFRWPWSQWARHGLHREHHDAVGLRCPGSASFRSANPMFQIARGAPLALRRRWLSPPCVACRWPSSPRP